MYLSVFDVFKIGVGPSSSHTMGPMLAASQFIRDLASGKIRPQSDEPLHAIRTTLYGSLSFTGRGHATDRAVVAGLLGFAPDKFDCAQFTKKQNRLLETGLITAENLPPLRFDPEHDLIFSYDPPLPGHPNGMIIEVTDANGATVASETYYSVGGGFILTARELEAEQNNDQSCANLVNLPYPYASAAELLAITERENLAIWQVVLANEAAMRSESMPTPHTVEAATNQHHNTIEADIYADLGRIWQVMSECLERGLATSGILPGGLKVKRRAADIKTKLEEKCRHNDTHPHYINDWISLYAMAVNEENAAGNAVVTSPTNGAAGVVPAVISYWINHCHGVDKNRVTEFLLTASAIGGLIKTNASISGAEVGCQGEVGSASAMAAAGLCAVLDGTPMQIENAAEIALEHHLGMTCDPVAGLVQVPCIERNGLGAIKAVSSASLALHGDGTHFVPLDSCIETMRQTGLDMSTKYKETSLGGLAVNLPSC